MPPFPSTIRVAGQDLAVRDVDVSVLRHADGDDFVVIDPAAATVTGTITVTAEQCATLLAVFFCQLEHHHDGDTCIPAWITLGDR